MSAAGVGLLQSAVHFIKSHCKDPLVGLARFELLVSRGWDGQYRLQVYKVEKPSFNAGQPVKNSLAGTPTNPTAGANGDNISAEWRNVPLRVEKVIRPHGVHIHDIDVSISALCDIKVDA